VYDLTVSNAIVILAAGKSLRFKSSGSKKEDSKLLVNFKGKPLVSWVLNVVSQVECDERIVVVKDDSLNYLIEEKFTILKNHTAELGLASSLNIGIHYALGEGHSAVTVALADMPFLTVESFVNVIAEDSSPLVATSYGQRVAHPIKIKKEMFFKLPTVGDVGAKQLMADFPNMVTLVKGTGSPVDIDTKEDLDKWS
jgi:CTP:molybdopterin cytidylyltransferase MocA